MGYIKLMRTDITGPGSCLHAWFNVYEVRFSKMFSTSFDATDLYVLRDTGRNPPLRALPDLPYTRKSVFHEEGASHPCSTWYSFPERFSLHHP